MDYENEINIRDFELLKSWKMNRRVANSMIIFLLVSVQENIESEIPPSYCVETLPSDRSHTSENLTNWLRKNFQWKKPMEISTFGN